MSLLEKLYSSCQLCPHMCKVDRLNSQIGVCGASATMKVAWVGLHKGEEPPLIGKRGSGTLFFSMCPLHCRYCQNYQISQKGSSLGVDLTIEELTDLLLELEKFGAANANIVTGTHYIPSIREALIRAKERGFSLPVVWNSSGFERVEALSLIDELIDIYLVDIKSLDKEVAKIYCGSPRYVDQIKEVIEYMIQSENKRVIVRHLIYPQTFEATKEVLEYFASVAKERALFSLMTQFIPPHNESLLPITTRTYNRLLALLEKLEIEEGFVQEQGHHSDWIPDFTKENPFPKEFATVLPAFSKLRDKSSDVTLIT